MTHTESRVYGYARVSTRDQNLDRQLLALSEQGIQDRDIIADKESGKDLDRKGYRLLKEGLLRRGDTLVVTSLDRLSRSKGDIKRELEHIADIRNVLQVFFGRKAAPVVQGVQDHTVS